MILASVTSCSNTESLYVNRDSSMFKGDTLSYWEQVSLLNGYSLSEEAVLKSVDKFNELVGPIASKASSSGKMKLKIISKEDVSLASNTRTSDQSIGSKAIIPIYYIEMNDGEKHGYALVSGDIRTSRVLAFVPDTVDVKTYEQYHLVRLLKQIGLNICQRQILRFDEKRDSLAKVAQEKANVQTRAIKMSASDLWLMEYEDWKLEWSNKKLPELSVTWGQAYPYNCKLPQMGCTDYGHDYRCPAGCGVVAIAHALAYYEPIMSINGQQVDWKMLKKNHEISPDDSKTLKNQIGFLMKWIGEKAGAKYSCESTNTGDVIGRVLNLVGIQCDKQSSFEWKTIFNSINNGHVVEANAHGIDQSLNADVGHSWIIDSYVIASLDIQNYHEQDHYVHCNFGWNGDFDGYYLLEDDGVKFETPNLTLDKQLYIHANIRKK